MDKVGLAISKGDARAIVKKLEYRVYRQGHYFEVHSGMTQDEVLGIRKNQPEKLEYCSRNLPDEWNNCNGDNEHFDDNIKNILDIWRKDRYRKREVEKGDKPTIDPGSLEYMNFHMPQTWKIPSTTKISIELEAGETTKSVAREVGEAVEHLLVSGRPDMTIYLSQLKMTQVPGCDGRTPKAVGIVKLIQD